MKRIPLIKFIGKRSGLFSSQHSASSRLNIEPSLTLSISNTTNLKTTPSIPTSATTVSKPVKVIIHSPNAVEFNTLQNKAMYGRPIYYQDEIDAIESGGATALDPRVQPKSRK